MRKITFAFFFFIIQIIAFGQVNYYVSNSGSDAANGRSPATAWKTIAKINTVTFVPGDSILFNRGDTWRNETVDMRQSGNASAYINYGAYGTKTLPKPRILGSTKAITWTATGTANIWRSATSIPTNPYTIEQGSEIFFEKTDGQAEFGWYKTYTAGYTNLIQEYNWTWSANTLYIYSPTDPNTRYNSIEAPQTRNAFEVNSTQFFTLDNLFIGYLASTGVRDAYGDVGLGSVRVTRCEIAYIGSKDSPLAYGLSLTHSNSYYAYNSIHDCGRRSISINLYDTTPIGTMQNVIIEHNHLYRGWHTTGIDCINSGNHLIDNITVRNNLIEDDLTTNLTAGDASNSNCVFFANQTAGTGVISHIYVYNNVLRNLHGKGLMIEAISDAYYCYNTVYASNNTIPSGQPMFNIGGDLNHNLTIKNNIIFDVTTEAAHPNIECLFMNATVPVTGFFDLDYNLYYTADPNHQILEFFASGTGGYDREYKISEWAAYRADYPTYDAHSPIPSNPLFNNAPNGDFTVAATSPAVGKGTPLPSLVTTDYLGNPRSPTAPTIGAYEYNPGANAYPVVGITSPVSGNTFTAPANITITATASDPDGTVSKVEFYNGTTKLGEDLTSPYSYSWTNVAAGSYSLTAVATDNLNAKTTSAVVSVTVTAPNTLPVVSITSPVTGATFTAPATVNIAATATDADGTISKVEFFNGATKLGEDLTSPYTFSWTSVAAGAYTLTAVATDNLNGKTTSAVVSITVNAAGNISPIVSITSPANGSTFTAPATVNITANAADADGTVSKVEFFYGTTKLGEDLTAPYAYSWTSVAAGTYSLTAVATDNLNSVTTSAAISITVNPAANVSPTVSITSPANGNTFTAPATINISATAADADGTVSKVEFFNGTTKLGEDLTAPYTYSWTSVAAGTYSLTAVATDNLNAKTTSAAVSVTVTAGTTNTPPVVAITAPANGSTYTAPATVNISANATDADGTISKVEFFNGTTKLGEKTTSPYNFTWSNVPAGSYSITAVATDNLSALTTSAVVSITVNAPAVNIPPSVIITSPGNGSTFTAPATVNISVTATDADGTISKVEFYNGTVKLGEKATAPYTFAWSSVAVGTYSLTAVATDNLNAKTTSSAVSITVNTGTPPANNPPVISITSPASGAAYAEPASVIITVNATDPDGTVSKVEFYEGAIKIGEVTTSPFTFTWIDVAAGTYSLSAVATDNLNATATSQAVEITVAAASGQTEDEFTLYPNPTQGPFTIKLNKPLQDEESDVIVVTSEGKTVYEGKISKAEIVKQYDMTFLYPGSHIMIIKGIKGIIATKKFIKQ